MSGNYRENNNNNSYTSIDKRSLLNPEIEDESPMFRRRSRAEEDDEERGRSAQNQEIRPKPKSPTWKGENAKSIVYGGLDAIVTCFSLISSISSSGGRMSSVDVLVLGFANLVADGISMGFGDYLSSSTEKEMAFKEKDVTQWEVDHHGTSQIRQLMQRYQELGMDPRDATTVIILPPSLNRLLVSFPYQYFFKYDSERQETRVFTKGQMYVLETLICFGDFDSLWCWDQFAKSKLGELSQFTI